MSSVIYPTRPAKCHDCPNSGRAWCLDGEGFPACDRKDDLQDELKAEVEHWEEEDEE